VDCENCGKAPAKVHMTEIVNANEKIVRHLCQECAEKLGYAVKQHHSISELLAGLTQGLLSSRHEDVPDVKCPSCGLTFAQFQTTGRFGCAQDYEAFGELIRPRIERFHDATQHVGKVPGGNGSGLARAGRLRALRAQLSDAVEHEAYERAAGIRDEIRSIEEPGRD